MVCNFCFSNSVYNKANIFLGLIEYELNSLLGASHLVDYISVHIRFDLERYLLSVPSMIIQLVIVERLRWPSNNRVVNSLEERRMMSKSIISSMGRKAWSVQEEVIVIFNTCWYEQNGLQHKKLCQNLCSWKSLSSTRSQVRSLIPVRS